MFWMRSDPHRAASRQLGVEFLQRCNLVALRRSALQRWRDKIAGVIDGEADQLVEFGIGLRRAIRGVTLDEPPRGFLVGDAGQAGEVKEKP